MTRILIVLSTFIMHFTASATVTEYVAQNKSGYSIKVKDSKKLLSLFSNDGVKYLSEGKVYGLKKSMPKNKLKVLKANSCIALGDQKKLQRLLKGDGKNTEFTLDHVYERPNRGGWAIIAYFKVQTKIAKGKFVISCQKQEMKKFFKWNEFRKQLDGLLTFKEKRSQYASYL